MRPRTNPMNAKHRFTEMIPTPTIQAALDGNAK
jgi:hypothetical protein